MEPRIEHVIILPFLVFVAENPAGFMVEMEDKSSYYHRDLSDSMSVYYKVLTVCALADLW
jgi:hypothetical protein